MNQKEHARFNHTYPDHTDSFSANFEQRRYLHDGNGFEQSAFWNSSSSSCCQPSKHHGRHGEPLYRSLLKPHHCSPHSFAEHVEGVHHRHHNSYLYETESTAAGSCLSSQYVNHSPCRCGSPMLQEINARIGLKGQSYYPNSALPNEITLYSWYLIRPGDSHTSDIAVGGFLSSRCNEVDRVETTIIVKRLEECKLLTKDGDVINLVGSIDDFRTVSNGFTLQTAHSFISGFPHIWKLLVGIVLPTKAAGTIRSTSGQRGYMQNFSASKGLETDVVSYSEGERSCGAKHATKVPCGEANEKIPMEQDICLLDVECQSKEDHRILYNQLQEKESDKNAKAEDNCTELTEHEASHGQKSTLNGPAEATDLGYELDMPNKSMEAAVSEIACGNKGFEVVITNGAKEKNHANEACGEAKVYASAEADKVCGENLDSATVQQFQTSEGELEMSKASEIFSESAKKKRKVASSSANNEEGGESLSQENSARSMEKSCNLFSQKGEELISSVISIAKQKSVVACKATAKKKGSHKRRQRVLGRSKRSTKPTEKLHANEALDEVTGDTGAKADKVCSGNLDLATGQPSQINEGDLGKDSLSKALSGSSSKNRKVSFNFAKDVEGEDLSSASLRLENSARSMKKSCSWASQKEELVSSVMTNAKQKVVEDKKSIAKRKGRHKRRGRLSLPRSKRSTKPMVAEATDLENIPVESIDAAVLEDALEKKEPEVVTQKKIKNDAKEKNYANEGLGEARGDSGAKANKVCSGNLDLVTVQPSQMDGGELGKDKSSKALSGFSLRKRIATLNFVKHVEGGDLSSASLMLESSARSMEKRRRWVSEKEELISSVKSITKRKVLQAKKVIAKRKGKYKRRGRLSLPRSKRFSKRMVTEATDPDNIPVESIEAAVSESAVEKKELEAVTQKKIKNSAKEKNYSNEGLGEVRSDSGAKADKECSENLDLVTLQPSQKNEGELGKDKLSKALSGSSSKKRKATLRFAKDVEGGDLSSASGMEKSYSLVSEKEELISSVISVAKQKAVEAKKAIVKRKGKHKRRGRLSLPRSKRSTKRMFLEKHETIELKVSSFAPDSSKGKGNGQSHDSNGPSSMTSTRKRIKMLPPPLPSPQVPVSTQLVSKAFGLKTSKSGRLLVPPLAHWCGQSVVRDKDGGIIAIDTGSNDTLSETGCFNFRPPIEARAKLQEWLSETASKCLTKKSKEATNQKVHPRRLFVKHPTL